MTDNPVDGKNWLRSSEAMKHIAACIDDDEQEACFALRVALLDGRISAVGPIEDPVHASNIPREYWRRAMIWYPEGDATNDAWGPIEGKQLKWFEVRADAVLALWPTAVDARIDATTEAETPPEPLNGKATKSENIKRRSYTSRRGLYYALLKKIVKKHEVRACLVEMSGRQQAEKIRKIWPMGAAPLPGKTKSESRLRDAIAQAIADTALEV